MARILDPARAAFYRDRGMEIVCPTRVAIEMLEAQPEPSAERGGLSMYLIVVGAGKVGVNLVRELEDQDHEVTLIESSRSRYLAVEQEFEHRVQYGDASELWVLERAGIVRADMVIAVTGDDEDNILICQVAKEKYGVDRIIARVNNPRNRDHFDLLGISPVVSATGLILNLIEHEVPHHKLVRLLDLESEKIEIIELRIAEDSPVAGRRIVDIETPDRTLLITILREGTGFVPDADSVLQTGDDILAVLDPDREEALKRRSASTARKAAGQGLEPRFHGPEPHELPLFYPAAVDRKDNAAPLRCGLEAHSSVRKRPSAVLLSAHAETRQQGRARRPADSRAGWLRCLRRWRRRNVCPRTCGGAGHDVPDPVRADQRRRRHLRRGQRGDRHDPGIRDQRRNSQGDPDRGSLRRRRGAA